MVVCVEMKEDYLMKEAVKMSKNEMTGLALAECDDHAQK